MAANGPPNAFPSPQHIPHDSGHGVSSMEEEVSFLTDKVASASQRFADYENEIRVLQAQLRQEKRRNERQVSSDLSADAAASAVTAPTVVDRPGISRFGSFMSHSRKSPSPSPAQNGTLPISGRERELEAALVKEQTERLKAEAKVKEVNNEIEDLSQNLFQEANDMVASERKENARLLDRIRGLEHHVVELQRREEEAQRRQDSHKRKPSGVEDSARRENARLKERIQFLEQRDAKFAMKLEAMQQRDAERKRRLERLERASERIERVRGMMLPR